MKPNLAAIAALALALAAPAAAQNSAAEPPAVPAPAPKSEPPPQAAPAPAPATGNVVQPAPVIVQQAAPPPAPVTISPDAAYPNGFADPADPFANDMALANRDQGGFPWGLLGLLGLLGLVPLLRGNGAVRTIYVERDDEPRRVVRRERIED